MTELLPNLTDLASALPSSATASDARGLVEAAIDAESVEELDRVLGEVVQTWLED